MDKLPSEIFKRIGSRLVLVDKFRFRRINRRFSDYFFDSFESRTILDIVEIGFQMRERNLDSCKFSEIVQQIFLHYGTLISKLKIVEKLDELRDSEIPELITIYCPYLIDLEFVTWSSDGGKSANVPFDKLLQMANVVILKAKLTIPDNFSDSERTDLFGKLQSMSDLNAMVINVKNCHFVSDESNLSFPSVKHLAITSELPGCVMQKIPQFAPDLDGIEFVDFWPLESIHFLPKSLRKLSLGNGRLPFKMQDLESLEQFSNLSDFSVDCVGCRDAFENFNFLTFYGNLELLSLSYANNFDCDAFANVPESAPLRHLKLSRCPAVCDDVFELIRERNYHIETIDITGRITMCEFETFYRLLNFLKKSLRSIILLSDDETNQRDMFSNLCDDLIGQEGKLSTINLRRGSDATLLSAEIGQFLVRRREIAQNHGGTIAKSRGRGLKGSSQILPLLRIVVSQAVLQCCGEFEQLSRETSVVLMDHYGGCLFE